MESKQKGKRRRRYGAGNSGRSTAGWIDRSWREARIRQKIENIKPDSKHLIQEAFSQKEDLSDQELEELTMGTHSDEV